MKSILIIFWILLLFSNNSFANFKKIKKKATITKPEIIFPIAEKKLKSCQRKLLVSPEYLKVEPILKVEAPKERGGNVKMFSNAGELVDILKNKEGII